MRCHCCAIFTRIDDNSPNGNGAAPNAQTVGVQIGDRFRPYRYVCGLVHRRAEIHDGARVSLRSKIDEHRLDTAAVRVCPTVEIHRREVDFRRSQTRNTTDGIAAETDRRNRLVVGHPFLKGGIVGVLNRLRLAENVANDS